MHPHHTSLSARAVRQARIAGVYASLIVTLTVGIASAIVRQEAANPARAAAASVLRPSWGRHFADAVAVAPITTTTTTTAPRSHPRRQPRRRLPRPAPESKLPEGKGMWIWIPGRADDGNPHKIVFRALYVGLTDLYIRIGSSKVGFTAAAFMDTLLPVAHANGLRVLRLGLPLPRGSRRRRAAGDGRIAAPGTRRAPPRRLRGRHRDTIGGHPPHGGGCPRIQPAAARRGRRIGADHRRRATSVERSWWQRGYPYDISPASSMRSRRWSTGSTASPTPTSSHTAAVFARYGKPVIPIGQAYDGGAGGRAAGRADRAMNCCGSSRPPTPRREGRGVLVVAARRPAGVGRDP